VKGKGGSVRIMTCMRILTIFACGMAGKETCAGGRDCRSTGAGTMH